MIKAATPKRGYLPLRDAAALLSRAAVSRRRGEEATTERMREVAQALIDAHERGSVKALRTKILDLRRTHGLK